MTTDQNAAPTERGLTPADLQNVRFTRASMMRSGYVDTEVDRVLSRVAEELGRLYAEKAALRDEVRSLQAQVDGVVIPEAPSEQAVRIPSSAQPPGHPRRPGRVRGDDQRGPGDRRGDPPGRPRGGRNDRPHLQLGSPGRRGRPDRRGA